MIIKSSLAVIVYFLFSLFNIYEMPFVLKLIFLLLFLNIFAPPFLLCCYFLEVCFYYCMLGRGSKVEMGLGNVWVNGNGIGPEKWGLRKWEWAP